jgi:hypothetical protein
MDLDTEQKKEDTPPVSSTRNAVETAIDMSRVDRKSTWEKLARKTKKAVGLNRPAAKTPAEKCGER